MLQSNLPIRAILWEMNGVVAHSSSASSPLNPALLRFIEALRPNWRTALLVQRWSELWLMVANQAELAPVFDALVLPEPGEHHRAPCGAQVAQALCQLDVRPSEALLVADSPDPLHAAQALGLRSIHFENPAQAGSQLLALLATAC